MPVNFIASVAVEGTSAIPAWDTLKFWVPVLAFVAALRFYFAGSHNTWDRDMHGRVVILTGATSGLGKVVAQQLAGRGCQLILLVRNIKDGWVSEYIEDLRDSTGNALIYAEEANLADLMSVRRFATKWLDNVPPRRLDSIVCSAATAEPLFTPRRATIDGLESQLQTNFLGHMHLLELLAPSLRSQPPDRDVRVVLLSCLSAMMGDVSSISLGQTPGWTWQTPLRALGSAKLAMALWAFDFQRRLAAYERKDKAPSNVHVCVVDPGLMRSPSFKRWFSLGSLWGLLVYLITWPLWWLVLKSSREGAQSVLWALMSPEVTSVEGTYISECRIRSVPPRKEFNDEQLQANLGKEMAAIIANAEKETARERAARDPPSEATKAAAATRAAKAAAMKDLAGEGSSKKTKKARK